MYINRRDFEKRIRYLLQILCGMVALGFFWMGQVARVFAGTIYDRTVYGLAALIGLVLVFGRFLGREVRILRGLATSPACRLQAYRVFVMSICIMMTLYYYDSASEYGHNVGLTTIVLGLGLIILSYLPKQPSRRGSLLSLLLIVLLLLEGLLPGRGADDYKGLILQGLLRLMLMVYIVAGSRLIHSLRREGGRTFTCYGIGVIVFCVLLLVFANGRLWTLSVSLPLLMLTLLFGGKAAGIRKGYDRLLGLLLWGVILSFWLMAATGLIFRPYYSFEFIRYPGWFASVASGALYRVLVAVSALVGYVSGRYKRICLLTLGASLTMLLLGMSRTSILSFGIVFVMVVVISHIVEKRSLKKTLLVIVSSFMSLLLAFPLAYSAVRCIPALVARPVWITHAEWFSDRIQKGEDPASTKYMNVPQLAESLLEKLAGIEINLSYMAGAESGPGDGIIYDENGQVLALAPNVVDLYKGEDGQFYTVKDYTFANDSDAAGANGRFEILEVYLKELNLSGHRTMIPENHPEDMVIYHAHNTYVQAMYDHGILAGLVFVLLVAAGGIFSIRLYSRQHGRMYYAMYPGAVICSFAMAGLTEWIFHPSIPLGLAFIIVMAPLARIK